MHRHFLSRLLPILFLLSATGWTQTPESDPGPKPLVSIRALQATISAVTTEREAKLAELRKAIAPSEKEGIAGEIRELSDRIVKLSTELESVATGIDVQRLNDDQDDNIAFDKELQEFFRPIVQGAKRATAKPRELEKLRSDVTFATERRDMAEKALEQLEMLISSTEDEETKEILQKMRTDWTNRREDYKNQLITAQYQLDERLANEDSLWDTLSSGVAEFFRTRGKNIFLALFCMGLTYFLLRFLHRAIVRYSPLGKKGKTFATRLFDVIYFSITGLLTICAGLAAFYALGDWMLLGFALILIAGFLWASKTAIPRVSEQIKLLLNLGPVREGERVVINGVPWQVKKINLYSRLVNPALEGGELRLPLRDLIPVSSRPLSAKEPFFPTQKGHWVRLADGTYGKVIRQTPEWVQLVLLGSAVKTFTTAEFVAQNPENISLGYRLHQTFGIDYAHQAIATTEVPEILTNKLRAELGSVVGEENITSVRVEFANAGASSLDMSAIADIKGDAAQKYNQATRAIQRICVDACNENDWIIPFTQITVHQAS